MQALAAGLGLSIRFHMRVRAERQPRAALGVVFDRAQPSVSFIAKVCLRKRILEMQL